jgi:hypothetical protein
MDTTFRYVIVMPLGDVASSTRMPQGPDFANCLLDDGHCSFGLSEPLHYQRHQPRYRSGPGVLCLRARLAPPISLHFFLMPNRAVSPERSSTRLPFSEPGIREGQLNSIRELASGQAQLLQQGNPDNQPVIASVKSCPDFEEILKEIKEKTNMILDSLERLAADDLRGVIARAMCC